MLRSDPDEDYHIEGKLFHNPSFTWDDLCIACDRAWGDGYAINGQLEKGNKTGLLHYQFFLTFKNARETNSVYRALLKQGLHMNSTQPARKDAWTCIKYTSKEDTRVEGYEPYGNPELVAKMRLMRSAQGRRNDLGKLRDAIIKDHMTVDDILRDPDLSIKSARYVSWLDRLQKANSVTPREATEQRDVKIHYLYGSPRIGKTRLIYDNISVDDFYRVTDYSHPFDNYVGQRVLVLDEYDSQFPITSINNYLDRYGCELPARYHNAWANWDEVWVISNLSISAQYPDDNTDKKKAFIARFTDITYMDKSGLFYDASDDDVLYALLTKTEPDSIIPSPWVFGKSRFIENPENTFCFL